MIISLLQVWRIRLQVTDNLLQWLPCAFPRFLIKKKTKNSQLILILPLRHERYAVFSDIINK